ncbi:hypothetical protein B7463_g1747, partial [Scytalidium lignicola]
MGIPGIYQEIGPGERVALSKLAIERLEQNGRPLRIAIDISIWQFQHQAGRGGSNPALRTLYYRILRLLSISVQPIFVFDGPNKPPIKRNKRTANYGGSVSDGLTKQLIELFGLPIHTAPGEAEAECALLQREGIVDAVLSEDVDTLMFGCGLTLRNWSCENRTGNHPPTHVSLYDAEKTRQGRSGLDREGMVLVALMSGGDYNTEGVMGCGIKVACEAARAGFGKSLCQLSQSDVAGMDRWKNDLAHELQTNEKKYFRVKHKALKIPENFPDRKVLSYYTHPVVSSSSRIKKLKDEICWNREIDVTGLRLFVANAFAWINKLGAKKFIRGLAPALLVTKLRERSDRRDSGYGDVVLTAMNEMELVRSIVGHRTHFDTGGVPELRVVYSPIDIAGLDLEAEPEDEIIDYSRNGLAPVDDDGNIEPYLSDDVDPQAPPSPGKRKTSAYDPTQLDKLWVPETVIKLGVPLKTEDYAESQRDPKAHLRKRAQGRKATSKSAMPKGAIEKFLQVTKPTTGRRVDNNLAGKSSEPSGQTGSPAVSFGSSASEAVEMKSNKINRVPNSHSVEERKAPKTRSTRTRQEASTRPKRAANPWAISQKPNSSALVTKSTIREGKSSSSAPFEQYTPKNHMRSSPPENTQSTPSLNKSLPTQKHGKSPSASDSDRASDGSRSEHISLHKTSSQRDVDKPSPKKLRKPVTKVSQPDPSDRSGSSRSPSPDLPTLADIFTRDSKPTLSSPGSRRFQTSPEPEGPIDLCSSPSASAFPADQTKTLTSGTAKEVKKLAKNGKKYIMLRESLPGSWKMVDEAEFASTTDHRGRSNRAWRMSGVERIDLTED